MTDFCVLDLDLDFFLSNCCPMAEPGHRPDSACAAPWAEDSVRDFLETRCGIVKPVPGAVFETHDRALDYWKDCMDSGALSSPFRVVHVDAHSDLGLAPPQTTYVEGSVLCQMPARRCSLQRYRDAVQLTEANYLLFAMAFRWVARLDNIRNPDSRPDMPPRLRIDGDPFHLQLRQMFPQLFRNLHGEEPLIPYREYADYRDFHLDQPVRHITLAMSPRYAPPEADRLADVIREYIL